MINYITQERAKYWPVSPELMAQYRDGSDTYKNSDEIYTWLQNGQYHRDGDKPAYINVDGTLYWYQNGLIHRDGDKPAIIRANGRLEWYQKYQRHRICGPAVIYHSALEWWINGQEITQDVRTWLNGKEWRSTQEQIFEFQLRFT